MVKDEVGPSRSKKRILSKLLFLTLVVILLATSVVLYLKYQEASKKADAAQADQQLIEHVAQMVIVPTEQPSVATVLDKSKLTNKELAERAENDDKLILYAKSKKVILYRPSQQKIVDILTIQEAPKVETQASTQP